MAGNEKVIDQRLFLLRRHWRPSLCADLIHLLLKTRQQPPVQLKPHRVAIASKAQM